MGSSKKVGNRYKLCRKQGPNRNNKKTPEQPRPTSSDTRKPSSSKVKLGSNVDYYLTHSDTLQYEIVDLSRLENCLAEIAVCRFCGNNLSISKKSLVGLATKITVHCVNCIEGQTTFNNCDHINIKTSTKAECKALTTLYDLNIRLVYGMRVIGKGLTSARSLCGILNIPAPPTVFRKYEKVLAQATDFICNESMNQAVRGSCCKL